MLTEQGELLYRTAQEVFSKLATTQILLADSKGKPNGELKVTTTMALGTGWLTPRLNEFMKLYPDIRLQLMLDDEILNLTMREADVAIWFGPPTHQDLVRRKLSPSISTFTPRNDYVKRFGKPKNTGRYRPPPHLNLWRHIAEPIQGNELAGDHGRDGKGVREPSLRINSSLALREAVLQGIGIAVLPDYLAKDHPRLVHVLEDVDMPVFDTYFVYPADLKDTKRVNVFRDFLVAKSKEWSF